MKKTMKKAVAMLMAVAALTGAAATTTNVFACDTEFEYEEDAAYTTKATVRVAKGYLALRTQPSYSEKNEIGALYTGDQVQIIRYTENGYVYVYSYTLSTYGYVNASYLVY